MSIPNGQSFNDSELSRGFHLLTESSHTVKINTPSVPPQQAHLYPRLAGSNWTCYLCQPCVVLGRSSTVTTPQKRTRKNTVDVDLGDSKAISRRHCEIRFSSRRDRWELYVYGRNGVKINHVVKKPKDRPAVLKPSALIEIDKTRFVFILPNNYIKPIKNQNEEGSDFDVNNDEEVNIDLDLENTIVGIFETQMSSLSTKELVDKLKETCNKPVDKENVLHLLVLSQKFELAPSFISSSFSDSDAVKWIYTPTKEKIDESSQEPSQERTIDSQTSSIVPLRSSVSKLLEREKSAKSGMTPPPISLSKLFIDDADWSMDAAIPGSFNDIDMDAGDDYDNNELSIPAEPPKPKPALFGGLSIESMYSMWMQADESDDDEERPKKRTKTTENEESVATEEKPKDRNIYKLIRTSALFS